MQKKPKPSAAIRAGTLRALFSGPPLTYLCRCIYMYVYIYVYKPKPSAIAGTLRALFSGPPLTYPRALRYKLLHRRATTLVSRHFCH